MSLVVICPDKDAQPWLESIRGREADLDIQVWPDLTRAEAVTAALCWKPPKSVMLNFPNLKGVISMGAGVDELLEDETISPELPLLRVVDTSLAQSMFEYCSRVVMQHSDWLDALKRSQRERQWNPSEAPGFSQTRIGVMGLGQIGAHVAEQFAKMGFTVKGWAQSPKHVAGVKSFIAQDLKVFLEKLDVLICLLPLTPDTEDILDKNLFAVLPDHAHLVHVGRGAQLNESDLLGALDTARLGHATLDVFKTEPLPKTHPFWTHPRITVTPHCSSLTNPAAVAAQVVENYRRLNAGKPPLNQVDRDRGY